jgi:translocation and assembly module TamA
MRLIRLFLCTLCAAACFVPVPAWAAINYTVQVEAPSDLAALLRAHLELINRRNDPDMDETLLAGLVKDTPDEAKRMIETLGYFNASVRVLEPAPRAYVVQVVPGEPALIYDVTIRLAGPIRSDPGFQDRFAKVLEAWPLPIGAPFHQDDWDSGKRVVQRLLTSDRYPFAKITASEAEIDPAKNTATLSVTIDSGRPIRFGPTALSGLKRYPADVALGLANYREGDPYQMAKLIDFQNALEQDPHFASAIVTPDFDHVQGDEVPVRVALTELPLQKIEAGLTYSNLDGAGVRLGYDYYNLFGRGMVGSLLADVKADDKLYSMGLTTPRQDNYSYSVTLTSHDSDLQGVNSKTLEGAVWRLYHRGLIDTRIGFEYVGERLNEGGVEQKHIRAVLLSAGWSRRELDDPNRPRNGTLLDVQLSGTIKGVSDTSFVRGYSKIAAYWTPFAPKYGTFVGRAELGQVWASNADNVPSTRLFRTGGPGSVRGYDVDSLGMPGPNGSIVGGRVLGVGSVEYQFPISRTISLALFKDFGNAADSWNSFKLEHSDGIGVRWASPFAPLAFDLARAERDGSLHWYIGLGLAF